MIDLEYEPKPPPDQQPSPLRPVIWSLCVLYIFSIVFIMLYIGDGSSGWGWLIPCVGFVCSPFFLLSSFAGWPAAGRRALLWMLAATVLNAVGGWFMMFNALYLFPDAQSGLIFLSMPPVQLVVAGAAIVAGCALDRK